MRCLQQYPEATYLLALPLGHELTQNVLLFGGMLRALRPSFPPAEHKIPARVSRRKVLQLFLSGTVKTDGPLVAGSCQTEIASGRFRDFGRLIRRRRRVAESSHLALLPVTSADLANET